MPNRCAALGDRRRARRHLGIDLARVGLARDGIRLVEPERRGHPAVERLDLGVVAVEEGQEARLGAGRPLDAEEFQVGDPPLDFAEVEDQLIAPEGRPLADRHELGGLEVGVAQAREILPASREVGQGVDRADEPVADQRRGPRGSGSGRCCR